MALATEEALWTSVFPPGNNKSETENADCCWLESSHELLALYH